MNQEKSGHLDSSFGNLPEALEASDGIGTPLPIGTRSLQATEITDENNSFPRDATDEEIKNLRHVIDHIPKAVWVVAFAGAAERFTYYAITAPWQNYMQNEASHRGQSSSSLPGALGLGQSKASTIYNAFFFFVYLAPLPFAVVSDTWLGRYRTLCLGLVFYMAGSLILFTTSLPAALDAGAGLGGLIAAMILIGLGVGSIKATHSPFLGDQYPETHPQVLRRKNGELVIADRTLTLQYIYNVFYWFTNIAALSSIATTFLEKTRGFWAAYLLPTCSLCITVILFGVWGSSLIKASPQGNVLLLASRTLVCASKNRFKLSSAKPSYQLEHFNSIVPWDDNFVAEIGRGLLACRVLFSFVLFYLCFNQVYNNLVSQAGQMDLGHIPNDAIQAMNGIACIILGPLIQKLYPLLAKWKIPFGPISRISVAYLTMGIAMAYAAGIQKLIYNTGPCYSSPLVCAASNNGTLPNNVSVWVQTPIYFILAVAEILGFVTASEYAYSKSPKNMKSVVQAFTQLTAAVGSALGIAISPVAVDPKLVIMYGSLAGVMGIFTFVFWWWFRRYDEIDDDLNKLSLDVPDEQRNQTAREEQA